MAKFNYSRLGCECLAAGLGGAIADGLFNPLAVLQVRAQLQPTVPLKKIARDSIALNGILRGLWMPGLPIVCAKALTFSGFRVGCYPLVRNSLPGNGIHTKLCAGCITGGIAAGLFAPLELVRIRMVSANPYPNTCRAFLAIACEEGVSSMWRGSPTFVSRAAIYSGGQLATYEAAKRNLLEKQVFAKEGSATHITASFISGLCGAFLSHPVGTLNAVIMDARCYENVLEIRRECSGSYWEVFSQLFLDGGIFRLYKGLLPSLVRSSTMVIVFMPIVEQLRHRLFGLDFI
eukprot:gnl/MRDRNA2_/MRDRNA2_76276_c0_seq1.p1 gnl/MRDRNA2_/MRDRNA2_76276_c0~~gnl/MRDRNA2_/MRDRNA2_76276_c0_seq1.p1  ORF type:complete len:290 (+),score=19.47 gnl/MRDRNA2_/MRDRNA2_76276_c0_seq1:92-961(+)